MDTDCLYLALSENELYDCIREESEVEWELEDCSDGPMAKYRKVLDEFINVTSTNRGFRTVHHSAATYEQTKMGLSYFYPKEKGRLWWYSHSSFEFVNLFIMHSNFL